MPDKVLIGEGQRFQVVWCWVQPQIEIYKLMDTQTNETLFNTGDKNPTVHKPYLYRICELLNELSGSREGDNDH